MQEPHYICLQKVVKDALDFTDGLNDPILRNASMASCEQINIRYPVLKYPKKITTLNPLIDNKIEGVLKGVKGQYLIFDDFVINIRKYAGYEFFI